MELILKLQANTTIFLSLEATNTQETKKDSEESAVGTPSDVLSQVFVNRKMTTLITAEWLEYAKDPESYCRLHQYD